MLYGLPITPINRPTYILYIIIIISACTYIRIIELHTRICITYGLVFSLKMECEKLASEKIEIQRHYVMVSEREGPGQLIM